MSSLKTLFIVAVLAAVAYGAYLQITRNQQRAGAPGEAPRFGLLPAQIPGPEALTPQFPSNNTQPGTAPPFSATATTPGGMPAAPQFVPPPGGIVPPGAAAEPQMPLGSPTGSPSAGQSWPQAPPLQAAPNPYRSPAGDASAGLRADPLPAPTSLGAGGLPTGVQPSGSTDRYETLLEGVRRELDQGRLTEAHLALSNLRDNPALSPAQAEQVSELLDQLAGTVIYSRQHLLEPAYTVKPGDTLDRIAESYNVPGQLLANINGIRDPQRLEPGRQLKVVRGPFNAVVHLDKHELVLTLQGRYAGTFPIGVGLDAPSLEGAYVVCNKTVNPQYYGPNREQVDADSPDNPLGEHWIGLGERMGGEARIGLHGTNDPSSLHSTGGRGWIRLGDRDIQDVFGILSIGPVASKVTVMR